MPDNGGTEHSMIFEKVAKILADYKSAEVGDIKPETTLEELGLDSLDTVELIMSFEDEFGVSLEVNDAIKSVKDIVNLIEDAMA